jgi:hypothetical protein
MHVSSAGHVAFRNSITSVASERGVLMSSVDSEILTNCTTCGASIYREHINRGLAGMWGGRMLCPACLKPKREPPLPAPAPEVTMTETVPLEGADPATTETAEAEPPATPNQTAAPEQDSEEPSLGPGQGARQVRTFHAKLSEAALRHMDDQVNTWLKDHPNVQVKFANTTVGVFEGKHSEPNLILTIFY